MKDKVKNKMSKASDKDGKNNWCSQRGGGPVCMPRSQRTGVPTSVQPKPTSVFSSGGPAICHLPSTHLPI